MVQQTSIQPSAPWLRLDVDDSDWMGAKASSLVSWYHQMLLIRRFEEKVLDLANAGLVHGPAHASIGQEATAVGAMSVLGTGDRINGTHRAHHQVLAKLINAQTPTGFNPLHDAFNPGMQGSVRDLMAEIMGLNIGYCGGRGGSMHMRDDASGIPGTSAIIGGNLPHAAGYALADKLLGTGNISVAFFGDGTMMAGPAYEAMNIAALYRLPVIFFAENNLYAVSTHINEQTRETRLASRGPMLGFPRHRMRRHGRGGGPPCHARSAPNDRRRWRSGADRGALLPFSAPERRAAGQRVRLPYTGRGRCLERARPARDNGGAAEDEALFVDIDPRGMHPGLGVDRAQVAAALYHVLDGTRFVGEAMPNRGAGVADDPRDQGLGRCRSRARQH